MLCTYLKKIRSYLSNYTQLIAYGDIQLLIKIYTFVCRITILSYMGAVPRCISQCVVSTRERFRLKDRQSCVQAK